MIKLYNDGKRITAALYGDIDHHAARSMRQELDEVIAHSRPELLILDLENVGFMDSSGIGLIMGRHTRMQAVGGMLVVREPNERIMKIFELAGLTRIVSVERESSKRRGRA